MSFASWRACWNFCSEPLADRFLLLLLGVGDLQLVLNRLHGEQHLMKRRPRDDAEIPHLERRRLLPAADTWNSARHSPSATSPPMARITLTALLLGVFDMVYPLALRTLKPPAIRTILQVSEILRALQGGNAKSLHIVRSTASAIRRHWSIICLNAAGVIVWAPSLTACSGSSWTSMIRASAPAAMAAFDHRQRPAVPCPCRATGRPRPAGGSCRAGRERSPAAG